MGISSEPSLVLSAVGVEEWKDLEWQGTKKGGGERPGRSRCCHGLVPYRTGQKILDRAFPGSTLLRLAWPWQLDLENKESV
jgi:hypothetical protein